MAKSLPFFYTADISRSWMPCPTTTVIWQFQVLPVGWQRGRAWNDEGIAWADPDPCSPCCRLI